MSKKFALALGALAGIAGFTAPAMAQSAVSISVGQPGFYGRINIGDVPQPRIVYAQPRVVERVVVEEEPIYLHVRSGEARHWAEHCRYYDACGRRVYFVNDNWYNTVYVEHYREHGEHDDRGYHHDHDDEDHDGDRRDDGKRHHKHKHGHGHD